MSAEDLFGWGDVDRLRTQSVAYRERAKDNRETFAPMCGNETTRREVLALAEEADADAAWSDRMADAIAAVLREREAALGLPVSDDLTIWVAVDDHGCGYVLHWSGGEEQCRTMLLEVDNGGRCAEDVLLANPASPAGLYRFDGRLKYYGYDEDSEPQFDGSWTLLASVVTNNERMNP